MRQAIVVKNPKWELFTAASDAFKTADAPAVLVVRGRCKEKRLPKTLMKATENALKSAKKAAALVAFGLLSALSAMAGDITSYLPATTIAGSATNTSGGRSAIGWQLNDIFAWQAAVNSTNNVHDTTKSNVVIRLNSSLNGTDIQANSYEFSIPTATYATNLNNTIGLITNTTGAKWLYIGDIENPNTNRVYIYRLYIEKAN